MTPGDGGGQGGLVCCDSWGHKESDTTEVLVKDLCLLLCEVLVKDSDTKMQMT